MPLDFPSSPSLNQIYTYGGRSWQWNGTAWDVYSTTTVVNTLNGLTGTVGLSAGSNITLTSAGNTITISSSASGGGISGPYVISFNGLTGTITGVSSVRGLTGTVGITNSSGIGLSVSGQTLTFSNTGVLSVNGSTGTITNIAKINVDNNFISAQSFIDPSLSASSSNISYNKISFYSDGASVYNNWVPSFGLLNSTITFPNTSGTLALTSGVVSSVRGLTGTVGITNSSGIGLSVSGQTLTFSNTGVLSFNGLTGAVTGVTTGIANTFTALQSFSAGISASGTTAASFTGTINCNSSTVYKPTLQYYNEPYALATISGNALSLDLSTSQVFGVTLNSPIYTFTITNTPATANRSIGFTLIFTADGTARGVTWGTPVKWSGGVAPTLTSTNGKKDIFTFLTVDAGTSWLAFIAGQNF